MMFEEMVQNLQLQVNSSLNTNEVLSGDIVQMNRSLHQLNLERQKENENFSEKFKVYFIYIKEK